MALQPASFRGPFACFADEGVIDEAEIGTCHSYRAAQPPDREPLLVVTGVDAVAHEALWRAATLPALPRVVASAGDATAFAYMPGIRLIEILSLSRAVEAELPLEVAD